MSCLRHAWNDWILHVHTNGHNPKSWFIALGLRSRGAAWSGSDADLCIRAWLQLYLRDSDGWKRQIARLTCVLYDRVICVNNEIAEAITQLGLREREGANQPAFLPIESPDILFPENIASWMQGHSPVISSTMFFRPEYGFELLLEAVSRLKQQYPKIGCFVMGSDEEQAQAEARALVERSRLTESVYLGGDLDHEMCLAMMSRSSMFVRPTFRDGDSISVREALSLGVPVVASNVGARPEGVVLFEPGDVDGLVKQVMDVICRRGL